MAKRVVDKAAMFNAIGYRPHLKQQLYHRSRARFKVAVCGRRFGKSTMAGRDMEPELLLPNRRYWIVGPTYLLGEKEFRVIWDDLIIGKNLGEQCRTNYNLNQGQMSITFPWRTTVEVRSAERPKSLVGEGLHGVIMSEAAKHAENTWNQYIRASLADYRGWASFPTTPEGMNWLYEMWRMGQDPAYAGIYESWRFPSWDNPVLYPGGEQDEEILLLKASMSEEEFAQEIAADFTAVVGRIFSEFNEEEFVSDVEFNPHLPNYACFDFGFTNPFVCLEFQVRTVNGVECIFVWREHYRSHTTVWDHIQILKGREQPPGYHVEMGFGDSEDPEAVVLLSQHFVPTLALPEAKINWRQGIDRVKEFMKLFEVGTDKFGGPIQQRRLIIDRSCTNLIRELNNYKAKQGARGMNPSELGANVEGHTVDALRYGLVHLFDLGAGYGLGDVMVSEAKATEGSLFTFREGSSFGDLVSVTPDARF